MLLMFVRRRLRSVVRLLPGPVRLRIESELLKGWLRRGRTFVPTEQLAAVYSTALRDLDEHVRLERVTYFEAGVFAGESLAVMVRTARARGVALNAWGVDSFEGLPDAVADDEGSWTPGTFACPRPVTEWNLRRQGVDPGDVELIEGWFDEALTPALAERIGRVDIAMLDADAYSSTVPVLEFLTPLLADRAWLIFDDWFSGGNLDPVTQTGQGTGVERAFDEWLAAQPGVWGVETISTYSLAAEGLKPQKAGMVIRLMKA